MNFGPHHYVPVLKLKRGEKRALGLLSASVTPRVTPLLEIVERTEKSVAAHLETSFKDLATVLRPFNRCFIDAREIAADGPAAAEEVFRRAATDGIAFTPVTSVSRSADVAAALAHRTNGIALRLSRTEFEAGNLERMLLLFMSQHGLSPEETDLIVDLGAVDDLVSVGIEAMAAAFLADVPDHTRWKTFTLTSSAFPPGMGAVDRHSYDLVDRADWLTWCQRLHGSRQLLTRLPTYSDGAIQHPKGVEGFDPRIMQVSASIRYTTSHSWLLIKGEGTRITPPSLQFPKLATQLVYGHLHLHYSGADHCAGCDSMMAAADGAPGLGSAEAWRRLGTVHHITTVVEQLGALPWP